MSSLCIDVFKMGEANTQKNYGKLSRELRTVTTIEWEVPDFFGLAQEVDHIESPEFSFLGAEWRLWVYPDGRLSSNSAGWVEIFLIRMNSFFEEQRVAYRLGIRKEDGTEYDAFVGEHNFRRNGKGWGKAKFVQRSALLELGNQSSFTNTVKFFCTFHEKCYERKETASQTISYVGLQTLRENLKGLLNGEDGDVVLKVKSKDFMAHKTILKMRSPIFRSMFNHKMKEDISGVVEITDCDPTAFKDFLHFVYCGDVEKFSTATVFDLYFVADKYDVIELKSLCADFIAANLSTDTFFDALALALKYQESTVLKQATNFFIENAIQIAETAEWLSFQKETPVAATELFIKTLKSKIPEK